MLKIMPKLYTTYDYFYSNFELDRTCVMIFVICLFLLNKYMIGFVFIFYFLFL